VNTLTVSNDSFKVKKPSSRTLTSPLVNESYSFVTQNLTKVPLKLFPNWRTTPDPDTLINNQYISFNDISSLNMYMTKIHPSNGTSDEQLHPQHLWQSAHKQSKFRIADFSATEQQCLWLHIDVGSSKTIKSEDSSNLIDVTTSTWLQPSLLASRNFTHVHNRLLSLFSI